MFNWLKNIFRKKDQIKISLDLNDPNSGGKFVNVDTAKQHIKASQPLNPRKSLDEPTFIWCLIGNVIGDYPAGIDQELKRGTKHFSANTKVYCFPVLIF